MSTREGVSVSLPLVYDGQDGPYRLNKTLKETVVQNFKNLVLTSPGERIMLPDFGCGLRQMLFENMGPGLEEMVMSRITSQIQKYMPFVNLVDVVFSTMETNSTLGPNDLSIYITFNILPLNEQATIEINEVIA